jgi:hypothetical protein
MRRAVHSRLRSCACVDFVVFEIVMGTIVEGKLEGMFLQLKLIEHN